MPTTLTALRLILDGIVDLVFSEIDLPSLNGDWRTEMRRRAGSVRQVLKRHRWAIGLMESRTSPGPATLRHHDTMIGALRAAGFSVAMTAHAYALIDSYVYGFALSEASLPINGPETVAEVAEAMTQRFSADEYPHLAEFATEHILKPGYDFGEEFEHGLTVILDAQHIHPTSHHPSSLVTASNLAAPSSGGELSAHDSCADLTFAS